MAIKLRVLISDSKAYPPTALCPVNSATPTRVKNDLFEGEVSVFVRGFDGEGASGDGGVYFDKRDDMTYGIVVRGRFLDNPTADDVVFGNVFESPIRDSLPWGTSLATKFMYFIDPTLELDLYADKPWALSPAVATMNHLSLRGPKALAEDAEALSADMAATPGPVGAVISEDALGLAGQEDGAHDVSARRRWFSVPENRQALSLQDVDVGTEFSNGVLDFNTLSATLPRPFTMSFPLLKYWDGQAVTYVCRRRVPAGESPVKAEGVYWAVAFEIIDEDARSQLEKRGGKVQSAVEGESSSVTGETAGTSVAPGEAEAASSDDID